MTLIMNWSRFLAILQKEFRQIRRDRLTFAMMVGMPIMQLILFGFAINTDPRHLPLALVSADESEFSRSFVAALETSSYFRITHRPQGEAQANQLLAQGSVQFVLVIPVDFSRRLMRGEKPAVLLAADATDPAASGNALAALNNISRQALRHDLKGPLSGLQAAEAPFEVRVQRRYNPEGLSRYNIVPGLIGVILTMTMVMMTSLAMTHGPRHYPRTRARHDGEPAGHAGAAIRGHGRENRALHPDRLHPGDGDPGCRTPAVRCADGR